MSYYAVGMSSITAVMTFKTAFPTVEFWWIAILVPVAIIGAVLLGYYLDKSNVSTLDMRKTNETTHRFLLTSDQKSQEFQMIQTETLLQALAQLSKQEEIDLNLLKDKYSEYHSKWKSPKN